MTKTDTGLAAALIPFFLPEFSKQEPNQYPKAWNQF